MFKCDDIIILIKGTCYFLKCCFVDAEPVIHVHIVGFRNRHSAFDFHS